MMNNENETQELTTERRAYAQGIADKYTTKHLREWSGGILSTPYEDASLMVAEDGSVLDVAMAYILKLEAERDQARKTAELLRNQSWDDFYRTETAYDGDGHNITDEEAMKSECSFSWDGEAAR